VRRPGPRQTLPAVAAGLCKCRLFQSTARVMRSSIVFFLKIREVLSFFIFFFVLEFAACAVAHASPSLLGRRCPPRLSPIPRGACYQADEPRHCAETRVRRAQYTSVHKTLTHACSPSTTGRLRNRNLMSEPPLWQCWSCGTSLPELWHFSHQPSRRQRAAKWHHGTMPGFKYSDNDAD